MMKKPEHDRKPKGSQVIAEAQALLGRLVVSGNRGGYLEGEHVAVLADPVQDDEPEGIWVLVTCHAFGHRRVDWEEYGIRARGEKDREGPGVLAPLDQRGQAFLKPPSPGSYSLDLVSHEHLCRELVGTALDARISEKARSAAVIALQALAKEPGKQARAFLASCLELLCDSSLPAAMRLLASQSFSSDSAIPLQDLDLTTCAAKLSQPGVVQEPEDATRELELGLARACGSILSARSLERRDERELLGAFIARRKEREGAAVAGEPVRTRGEAEVIAGRVKVVKTRMAVRTRGGLSRPPGPAGENPLIVLARTGGARVRNALIELLSAEAGNEPLISELKNVRC